MKIIESKVEIVELDRKLNDEDLFISKIIYQSNTYLVNPDSIASINTGGILTIHLVLLNIKVCYIIQFIDTVKVQLDLVNNIRLIAIDFLPNKITIAFDQHLINCIHCRGIRFKQSIIHYGNNEIISNSNIDEEIDWQLLKWLSGRLLVKYPLSTGLNCSFTVAYDFLAKERGNSPLVLRYGLYF